MKKHAIRILAAAAMLALLSAAGTLTAAAADEPGFAFAAFASAETAQSPTRIPYAPGDTVEQALQRAGIQLAWEGGFLQTVNGCVGNYVICCDHGGYDLTVPASSVTAVFISENTRSGEAHLELLCAAVEFREAENHVQSYVPAAEAYEDAVKLLRSADEVTAQRLLEALRAAEEEYARLLDGPRYTVSVTAVRGGTPFTAAQATFTDAYGNVTLSAGGEASLIAGEYRWAVSDGGWNRTEGTLCVPESRTVSAELPTGEWFGEINLLNTADDKKAIPYTADPAAHRAVYQVPDTVGSLDVIVNAFMGGDVPDRETTKLYGIYTEANGADHSGLARSWESTATTLVGLLEPGMGERSFDLEARYARPDGTVQIQSYTLNLERVPTLSSLTLTAEGTVLPLPFRPLTGAYTTATTADTLDIGAEPFGADYSVTGLGRAAIGGDTSRTVTVRSGDRENSYTVQITKMDAVNVRLAVPAETNAEVRNAADAVIAPVNGVYRLVPGERYRCIAEKNTFYHTELAFTASDGLTVAVPEPETEDRLSDFALQNARSASTRQEITISGGFSSASHELQAVYSDAASSLYAQATPLGGYAVKVFYDRQTTNASTCGQYYETEVTAPVSVSGSNTILSGCLCSGGFSPLITIRLSRVEGNVTYYQDYYLRIARQLHLRSLSVSDAAGALSMSDAAGNACSFDRDNTEYHVTCDRAAGELILRAAFISESGDSAACGGYYAEVNGIRTDSLAGYALPLDEMQDEETFHIRVCHADDRAEETTYRLTVGKTDPVPVTFRTAPADATVFLVNNTTGRRIFGENGVYALTPGGSYTYTVTCSGYVGQRNSLYTPSAEETEVTVALTPAPAGAELPDYAAAWPSFRADGYNNGVVNDPLPASAEDAVLSWAVKLGEGYSSDACGCPILVNGFVYTYAQNRIYKLDSVSGEILTVGTMDHSSSFAINTPTYAEGMIFVGLADGTVQAFNADTLQPLWIYHDPLKGQPNCPIVYRDGYIYTGFWLGETTTANYVCLSVTDEDPASSAEEKLPVWTYSSRGGFYWAGAYVSDRYLIVGTDDGESGYTAGYARILSLDPRTGAELDARTLPYTGDQRSAVTFVPTGDGNGKCYFTTKGGYFYEIPVGADGRFTAEPHALRLYNYASDAANPAMSTSTPTVYNGRAYVGVSGVSQFGAYSGHNITVIDIPGWSIAYTVRTQGYPQTSGLLTTAQQVSTGAVNVYFFDNFTPGKLRMLTDRPGQTRPDVTAAESYVSGGTTKVFDTAYPLFTPWGDQAQYAICSPICDAYGTIYFKNDSAYLMALTSRITALEITQQPDRTEYAPGDCFDGTGMQVTARYANGTSREVTGYVRWSEEPLTADDTAFQIFFPYVMYHDGETGPGTKCGEPFAVLELQIAGETRLPGDVNGDGDVNILDAGLVIQYSNGMRELDAAERAAADVNGDDEVSIMDAGLIIQYSNGYLDVLPTAKG